MQKLLAALTTGMASLSGYKTHMAGAAIVLVGLLYGVGAIDQPTAIGLFVPLFGVAQICQRLGTSKTAAEVADLATKMIDAVRPKDTLILQEGPQQQIPNGTQVPVIKGSGIKVEERSGIVYATGEMPIVKTGDSGPLLTLLAAVLLFPACASAQFTNAEPRAIIQGPTAAIPGEMIVLDASQSEGADRFRWTISPELRGRKQLIEIDQGKRCQIASYGGRYVVTLAVSNTNGIDLLTWELNIAGQPPCPPPEPVGPVQPDPIVPDPVKPVPPQPVDPVKPVDPVQPVKPEPVQPPDNGRFSLAPEVFRIASTAASATRTADCLRLASECERIASASWDGMTPMAAEIVRVLNTLPAGWQELKSRTQTAIAGLYSNGLIKSRDDIAALLRELKVAFERAAQVQ